MCMYIHVYMCSYMHTCTYNPFLGIWDPEGCDGSQQMQVLPTTVVAVASSAKQGAASARAGIALVDVEHMDP